MRQLLLMLFVSLWTAERVHAATEYSSKPGPYPVASLEQTWHDAKRNRDVPVKIYYPKATATQEARSFPVVIFSHGLGGSRDGYGYLGEHWASSGYISVHVQHLGSDSAILHTLRPMKALRDAAMKPENAINRPLDVSFAIDRLTALNLDPSFPLHGQIDLSRLGVAGHSFGAFTTMALAGARIPILGTEPTYLDPRIKAAIAMSTPSTIGNDTDSTFDAVKIPIFHLTGTKDESPGTRRGDGSDPIVGETKAGERLRPFRHTQHAPAYLLVFEGGDHMVFSGRMTGTRAKDSEFQARILSGSTAFWDAWLREDSDARHWLESGGFATALGYLGTFEQNHPR